MALRERLFGRERGWASVLAVCAVLATTTAAWGQTPIRSLSGCYFPGDAVTVSIAVGAPPGTVVVGVEEQPPSGWTVTNISNNGDWDAPTRKIKWGPFFGGSIPTTLTYDVTVPAGASGAACFSGTVSFDGLDQTIGGPACLAVACPAVSALGLTLLAGAVALIGGAMVRRRFRCPATV